MDTQFPKCGHKHRPPGAAQKCFIKGFFVDLERSIQQGREQRREEWGIRPGPCAPKWGIHNVAKEQIAELDVND